MRFAQDTNSKWFKEVMFSLADLYNMQYFATWEAETL